METKKEGEDLQEEIIEEVEAPEKKKRKKKEEIKEEYIEDVPEDKKTWLKKNPNPDYLLQINWNDYYGSKPERSDTGVFWKYYDENLYEKYNKWHTEMADSRDSGVYGLPNVTTIIFNIYALKGYYLHHIDKFQEWLSAIDESLEGSKILIMGEEMNQLFEENKDKDTDLHKLFRRLFKLKEQHIKRKWEDSDKFNYSWHSITTLNYWYIRNALGRLKAEYSKQKLLKNIAEEGSDYPHSFLQKITLFFINNHWDKIKAEKEIIEENN